MQRYFTEVKNGDKFILNESDSHHTKNVMRFKIGEMVEVVYKNELFLAEIVSYDPTTCKLLEKTEIKKNKHAKIFLAQSLVKEQKMDLIIQKNTEIGIDGFIPISTSRSIVKLKKGDKKIDRWKKIAKEASEQSKRLDIPEIYDITSIDELSKMDVFDLKLLLSVRENTKNIKKVLTNLENCDTIIIVVGPEGGFTIDEEEKLIDNGFIRTSLGENILRTETAGIFFSSIIRYLEMEK